MNAVEYVDPGSQYTVTTVPICYDQIEIKVRGQVESNESLYSFVGCDQTKKDRWVCDCLSADAHEIILVTKPNITNEYDITVQYYTEPLRNIEDVNTRHSATRTFNYNDIKVTFYRPDEKKSSGFFFPALPEGSQMTIIIFAILLLFGMFIFFVYVTFKVFFMDEKPKKEESIIVPAIIEEDEVEVLTKTQRELDEIFKDL